MEKNTGSTGTFIYPPKLENVRAILEAVRELGLETYRLKEVGGADFLLGRLPIKLYLYGGGNPDENGVERLNNPQLTAAEDVPVQCERLQSGRCRQDVRTHAQRTPSTGQASYAAHRLRP